MNTLDYLYILLPALISTFITLLVPMDKEWYKSLSKPSFTPPPIVFSIVWPILYLSIGFVLFYNTDVSAKKILFVNLFLNYLWVIVFNYFKDLQMTLVIIILMLMTLMYYFVPDWNNLSIILVPYAVWLTFATYLNYQFYIMN